MKRIFFLKYFQLIKNNILNKEESRKKNYGNFYVSNLNVILYTQVLLYIDFYILQK